MLLWRATGVCREVGCVMNGLITNHTVSRLTPPLPSQIHL